MNTYDNEITLNGQDCYLTATYFFDESDNLHFREFQLTDEDFNEITLDEVKSNEQLFGLIETLLANESSVCYGGAPC